MKRSRVLLGFASAALVAVGFAATCGRGLTSAQATEIRDLFVGDDPASYRFVLPVFEGDRVVRTEVFGSLPLDNVRQIAARQSLELQEAAQIHAVVIASGNGGAGNGGGGGGSMAPTPAKKLDRLHQILEDVNPRQYQLIVQQSTP